MSTKDYARRPELRKKLSHVEWMRRLTFEALNRIRERAHSEFKKPYWEDDHLEMEHWPDYPWPVFRPPLMHGPTPLEDEVGGPGVPVVWKVCMPGCHPSNPSEIPGGSSDWIKFRGFCPSIFNVQAKIIGGTDPDNFSIGEIRQFNNEGDQSVWGAYVTAAADADGWTYVEFTIMRYGFVVTETGIEEDHNDIITHTLKCQVRSECCPSGDFAFDNDSTADTIDPNDSITVYITGGCPPFSWAESGTDFSLDNASTTARQNTLNAGAGACGTCTITVTDSCSDQVTGYVRSTVGAWLSETAGCNLTGHGTPTPEGGGYQSWEYIEGNKKQSQWTFCEGTRNYTTCEDDDCTSYCNDPPGVECEPCIDWNTTYGVYQTPCMDAPTTALPDRSQCYTGLNFYYYEWECA